MVGMIRLLVFFFPHLLILWACLWEDRRGVAKESGKILPICQFCQLGIYYHKHNIIVDLIVGNFTHY